ncbi:MAG: putative sulfate exporter family transporter [Thermoanaerobaculia bacterium]
MTVALFIAVALLCLSPWLTPPIALALGVAFALTLTHPFPRHGSRAAKILLQASVVGLGFGMNLQQVVAAGKTGVLFTVVSIAGTLLLGFLIGHALSVNRTISHLISSGTAICGGSAIAAVAPVIDASDDEISVSLATVFILNSIALFVFPLIGVALQMSQKQFGVWAAIAIHDTSSVVGAASRFGTEALRIATPVKLARALWIVPLTIGTAAAFRRKSAKITIPWFIFLFLIASILRTYVSAPVALWDGTTAAARAVLKVTLFLIGAGLSRKAIAAVGVRPLILGVLLWITISIASLFAVMHTL